MLRLLNSGMPGTMNASTSYLPVVLDPLDVLRRRRVDDVGLAVLQRDQPGRDLLDHPVGDRVEVGRATVRPELRPPLVVRVALQDEGRVVGPALHLERAGGDRVHGELVAQRLDGGHRGRRQVVLADVAEERDVRLLEDGPDRVLVHHLGLVVRAEPADLERLGGRIDHPVVGRLDGRRVERRAVVELDVLAQVEGVDLAVRRDLPLLGQARHELAALRLPDQRIVDLAHDPGGVGGRPDVGVQAGRLLLVDEEQVAARLRRAGGWRGCRPASRPRPASGPGPAGRPERRAPWWRRRPVRPASRLRRACSRQAWPPRRASRARPAWPARRPAPGCRPPRAAPRPARPTRAASRRSIPRRLIVCPTFGVRIVIPPTGQHGPRRQHRRPLLPSSGQAGKLASSGVPGPHGRCADPIDMRHSPPASGRCQDASGYHACAALAAHLLGTAS